MSLSSYLKRGIRYILYGTPNITIKASISYLTPDKRLLGKRIIITGGGRGLGRAMAERFVAEGANVLISGRTEATLKEVAGQIGCQYLVFDVCEVSKVKEFLEKADEMLGGVNTLVNNAGISLHEPGFLDVTPESFDAQFETNLKGGFF